ncbi:MAG: hypothetical protein HC822_10115 [Oscillochloris sp.]|nr:hypothetical protein [Oscillochloris sp.]
MPHLLEVVGRLAIQGIELKLDQLFVGRAGPKQALSRLLEASKPAPLAPTTWMIDGGHARPASEPRRLPEPPLEWPAHVQPTIVPVGTPAGNAATPLNGFAPQNGNGRQASPAPQQTRMPNGAGPDTGNGRFDAAVATQFQGLMSRFLATQRSVMGQYLAESPAAPLPPAFEAATPQLNGATNQPSGANGAPSPHGVQAAPATIPAAITRYSVQPQEAPPHPGQVRLAQGVVVISADDNGAAEILQQRMHALGQRALLLDPAFPGEPEVQLAELRQKHGPIVGLFYLAPLRNAADLPTMPLNAWPARLEAETTGLYRLLRALAADLNTAANNGGAAVMAVTAMGGTFGSAAATAFLPLQAGVVGLLKSVALEWPHVLVRAVDLERQLAPQRIAEYVLAELSSTADRLRSGMWRDAA